MVDSIVRVGARDNDEWVIRSGISAFFRLLAAFSESAFGNFDGRKR
jgi:hypothetical protein